MTIATVLHRNRLALSRSPAAAASIAAFWLNHRLIVATGTPISSAKMVLGIRIPAPDCNCINSSAHSINMSFARGGKGRAYGLLSCAPGAPAPAPTKPAQSATCQILAVAQTTQDATRPYLHLRTQTTGQKGRVTLASTENHAPTLCAGKGVHLYTRGEGREASHWAALTLHGVPRYSFYRAELELCLMSMQFSSRF